MYLAYSAADMAPTRLLFSGTQCAIWKRRFASSRDTGVQTLKPTCFEVTAGFGA